jgi:hypothetical protein
MRGVTACVLVTDSMRNQPLQKRCLPVHIDRFASVASARSFIPTGMESLHGHHTPPHREHTHTRTHTRMHACTHARTYARTHARNHRRPRRRHHHTAHGHSSHSVHRPFVQTCNHNNIFGAARTGTVLKRCAQFCVFDRETDLSNQVNFVDLELARVARVASVASVARVGKDGFSTSAPFNASAFFHIRQEQ